MFSQSADQPAADDAPAPAGMRELPPQPPKPVMPAYSPAPPTAASDASATPAPGAAGPGPDDSVIARDDHLEGTFTSRGTVVVRGSVKGRIEAVQVRIEDGATVDADVIVDEAIIAGEFTGNLTCRQRLEARASGRINGRVETFRLMLHEGASVEGEMHMLSEAPKDASETIRGSAPLRGGSAGGAGEPEPRPAAPAAPAADPVPTVTPSSGARPTSAVGTDQPGPATTAGGPDAPADQATSAQAAAVRSSIVEKLKSEGTRIVAPRTTATTRGYGYSGARESADRDRKRERPSTTGI
jgi:cytoskeletal protein CcmA (bactofilin family)